MSFGSEKQRIAIIGLVAASIVATNIVFAVDQNAGNIGTLFTNNEPYQLRGEKISADSILGAKLKGDSVTSTKIRPGVITKQKVVADEVQIAVNGTCDFGINEIRNDGSLVCTDPGSPTAPTQPAMNYCTAGGSIPCIAAPGSTTTPPPTPTTGVWIANGTTDPGGCTPSKFGTDDLSGTPCSPVGNTTMNCDPNDGSYVDWVCQ